MKKISFSLGYKLFLAFVFSCLQVVLWAQDNPTQNTTSTKTTTTTTETVWYTQPWVWIVGGAVFLIILVALLRGNSTSNTESRTTVIKDNV